jgi:hypothetical protein
MLFFCAEKMDGYGKDYRGFGLFPFNFPGKGSKKQRSLAGVVVVAGLPSRHGPTLR